MPRFRHFQTVAFLATALFSWPAGWLLERIDSRFLISAGVVVIAAGFMTASQATHFGPLIAAYAIIGSGVGLGTIIPAAVVVTVNTGVKIHHCIGVKMHRSRDADLL
jgi:MFS family permease